jgi:hypothetical protein
MKLVMRAETLRLSALVTFVVALCTVAACGGGGGGAQDAAAGGNSTQSEVTGVRTVTGTPATFTPGALPAPHGSLTVSVPATGNVINGGSTQITVAASGDIVTVYVSVAGKDGYYQLSVPAGSSVADVLLTLAQLLPAELTIVFEAADAAGNVSAPAMLQTTVTTVGTGDLQVSVSWDVKNDIDLHVVDPNQFEIYYIEQTSPEGGMLDLDSNAGCEIDGIDNENVRWPTGTAPHGAYIVRVDNFEQCTTAAVNYVVTVQKTGQAAQTFTGTFAVTDPGDEGIAGSGVTVTQFTFP